MFNNFDEMNSSRFKGWTNFADGQNFQKDSFNNFFKINSEGISEYTMAQIRAKAAVVDMTDSLTAQAIAMASDADFMAKVSTGKVKFAEAFKDSALDIEQFGEILKNSGKLEPDQFERLTNATKKDASVYKNTIQNILNDNEELANSFINLGVNTSVSTNKFGNTIKGMSAQFKAFATSLPGMLTLASIGITAALQVFDYFYESYDEALEKASQSASEAQSEQSNLESLQTELTETNNKIDELNSKESLTLTEESDLARLKEQNAELERQIEIQKRITEATTNQASKDAENVLSKKDWSEASMYNDAGDKIPAWLTMLTMSNGGIPESVPTKLTDSKALEADLAKITEFEQKIEELKQLQLNAGDDTNLIEGFQKKIDQYKNAITELEIDASQKAETIQTQLDNISDKTSDVYKENYDALTQYINRNVSAQEQAVKSLDAFFGNDSGKFIKQSLIEASKSGKDLESVLRTLGISLSDLGSSVTSDYLQKYFDDITNSATAASEAVNKVDGSIGGITAAFESENAGDNYVKYVDYLNQAKELYDQGLVGLDDFKSVTEAMSYSVDSSADYFAQNYDRLSRYFNTEDPSGVQTFLSDLSSAAEDAGKSWAKFNEATNGWDINIENSAEAAKAMNMSTEMFESLMGRMKDYGANFTEFKSTVQDLNDAQTALLGLKSIYDNMDAGTSKNKLGERISQWEQQLSGWENDLSTLDTDIVMNLKLEYDLATLQTEINEARKQVDSNNNGAEQTRDKWANVISANDTYISTAQEGVGLTQEGVQIPVEYVSSQDSLNALRNQLGREGLSDEQIMEIQAKIVNLQDVQKELLDTFANLHPEINGKSTTEEITNAWNSFVQSIEGQEIIAKINADGLQAKEEVAKILGVKPDDIVVNIKANDEVSNVISNVEKQELLDKSVLLVAKDEASGIIDLWNSLYANPKFSSLTAQDQATWAINLWNAITPEQKTAILQASDNGAIDVAKGVTNAVENVPNANPNITAHDNATNTINSVSSLLFGLNGLSAHTYLYTHKIITNETHESKSNKFNGTAHVNGTANSRTGHAFARGDWSVQKNERALVGELGQELIVRNGHYQTIGDNGAEFVNLKKGDIIFNHEQTKNLLSHGYINSRAKVYMGGSSYAQGTAYAYAGGFTFQGGASEYNVSYPTASAIVSDDTASNAQSVAESTSDAAESTKEFSEEIDYIEIILDRIERKIKSIERISSSAYNTFDKRNSALKDQISAVTHEIGIQQKAYEAYLNKANSVGLSADYASKVRDGSISIETITDENLNEQIQAYSEWYNKALDCKDAIDELKESVRDLYKQEFDNLTNQYDSIIDLLDHQRNMLEGYIDQTEAQGYISSAKYYTALIENEEGTLSRLNEERNQLIASMNNALNNGNIQKYSEAWYDMQSEINSVNEAIQESTSSIIEFQNSIREIQWDVFDKIQDSISTITDESDFLIELMSRDKLYDDQGNITNQGRATIGLHGVNYNTYMSQADEYKKELDKINESLKSDPYNQDLIERRKELIELQQESILAAEDEKDAIKDLVEDGINAQLDSLQDLIDKYTDMLDSQKDAYDYQKEIAEKQKEIAEIEKQLAAYQGDNSEEGRLKRQELENQLNDAKTDMAETQYDKSIAEQKKLLDELYTEYETILNIRFDNIDMLITDVISNVNMEASAIRDVIISESQNVGYQLSDSMATIWGNTNTSIVDGNNQIVNVITTYGEKFTASNTNVQTAINDLKNIVQQAINVSNRKAQENISNTNKQQNSQGNHASNTTKPSQTPTSKPASSQGNGVANVGDAVTFVSGNYYYSSDGISPIGNQMHGQTVYITQINDAAWATKKYHIARDKAGTRPLGWVSLEQLKGYSKGIKRINNDQLAFTDEYSNPETIIRPDGGKLTLLTRDDSVLNHKAHENIWELANNPDNFIVQHLKGYTLPESTLLSNVSDIKQEISVNIGIDKVMDYNDFIRQIQQDTKFEKLIQTMTLGQISGQGKLSKYSIKF